MNASSGPSTPTPWAPATISGAPVSRRDSSTGPCRCSSGTSPTPNASWDPTIPTPLAGHNNLAGAYEAAGDPARAIPIYLRALAGRERVLGPEDLRTLVCRDNLARAHELTGNPARAVPLHERTLTDRERALGPGHPDTLLSLSNLAYAHHRAQNRERSAELFARALSAGERHLGPEHPATRHVQELLSHVRGG
ncbi:tetratricopeptide repeat protein [Streptomyces sp. NPDC060065]|uniref:tetratricopeptide repeat protein n=1 Tax=Streptomyces sp. NPDC060065 TaxID=3347050 RepID=UPI0036B7F0AA